MFCLNCGKKIPAKARFCQVCGALQEETDVLLKEGPPQQSNSTTVNVFTYVNTQQNRIQPKSNLEAAPDNPTSMRYENCEISIKTNKSNKQYIAHATGYNGNYVAAKSAQVLVNLSKSSWLSRPQLESITKKLIRGGWEPIQSQGPFWYSLRFRRKILPGPPKYLPTSIIDTPLPVIPGYEVCEIKAKEFTKYNKIFVCLAPNPEGGFQYEVGNSTPVSNDLSKQGLLSNTALQALCKKLKAEGWQPIEPPGPYWYSYRFRRPIYTIAIDKPQNQLDNPKAPSTKQASGKTKIEGSLSPWPDPPSVWPISSTDISSQLIPEISKNQVCEIEVRHYKNNTSSLVAILKNEHEHLELFRSLKVAIDWSRPTLYSKPHLDLLVKRLKKEGWKQLEACGEHWYSLRFQK